MNRRQKYPNTTTFRFYNANPKDRITGDCVYRAVATATKKPWADVVKDLAMLAIETGYSPASKENVGKYLEMNGFEKQKQPRKANGKKYTGEEFCKLLNKEQTECEGVVANIGGHHIVSIMPTHLDRTENWKVFDIWDSTDGCIGNYWIKVLE